MLDWINLILNLRADKKEVDPIRWGMDLAIAALLAMAYFSASHAMDATIPSLRLIRGSLLATLIAQSLVAIYEHKDSSAEQKRVWLYLPPMVAATAFAFSLSLDSAYGARQSLLAGLISVNAIYGWRVLRTTTHPSPSRESLVD